MPTVLDELNLGGASEMLADGGDRYGLVSAAIPTRGVITSLTRAPDTALSTAGTARAGMNDG